MNLTKENYKLIAAKLYRNPILIDSEFAQDLILINRIVNRIKKFASTGELKVKLLYNHYTVACNCFGTDYVNRAIFLLADSAIHNILFSMLYAFTGNESDIVISDFDIVKFDKEHIHRAVIDRITREIRE